MEKNINAQSGYFFFIIFVFILVGSFIYLYLFSEGFIQTTIDGEHTGTITAVELNGIFFKTYSVYFKSDAQSSQEDIYCVIDKKLIDTLKEKAVNKSKVTISYIDYFIIGQKYCNGEPAIIIGIK